ncbi:ATP-binding protein [Pseudothauera rhizosphaerae]|uniref:Sensor protein n=1 Tax=Pseudothauera rhizosphaerae TaxID=2565932 RepID=A0A4S4ALD3_9RHOO|nr:ATP-binding protein [Pseudothauera rhizosphaerae]THF60325.1 HAMP domain-containing protein [Pseudothauera rhizosphaerae]
MNRIRDALAKRSILLLVGLAMLAVTLISVAGMSASVVVAETVQGSGSAINVAGSLRRLTHRIASLVVADALQDRRAQPRVAAAIEHFEVNLAHPALMHVLERAPNGMFAATYRGVDAAWRLRLKPLFVEADGEGPPPRTVEYYEHLLVEVDAFVDQLNTLVAVLEHDTEASIRQLRTTLAAAIALAVLVVAAALFLVNRALHRPLADLLASSARFAHGDFGARVRHTGRNELGRVGAAFNQMAEELSKLYRDLERRVQDKTAELQRTNRSLELLYHAIARLYHAPDAPETYEATLRDIEQILELEGSFACLQPKHEGPAVVLASSLGPCPEREREPGGCALCRGAVAPWAYHSEGGYDLLMVPLRDAERTYGMLRLALPTGRRLQDWQRQLLEALSRHIGMALGMARRTEQERLLALQEERSIIARELHDSLAQSLSYMKIQVSLLQRALADPARAAEAEPILADLREGINSAYRQLRELLASFRLKMEGDFRTLLDRTVAEYAARGGVPIGFEARLAGCHLTPNQEIHVLHIIREALSNMLRHAHANHAWVRIACPDGRELHVAVEDDGIGLQPPTADGHHHYGMTIMRERAHGLHGDIAIGPRPGGGTRVALRFPAAPPEPAILAGSTSGQSAWHSA